MRGDHRISLSVTEWNKTCQEIYSPSTMYNMQQYGH